MELSTKFKILNLIPNCPFDNIKVYVVLTPPLLAYVKIPVTPPSSQVLTLFLHGPLDLFWFFLNYRFVEVLDMYFGSVCELDIIFNFEKAYFILDELVLAGEIQDTSKKSVLRQVELSDSYQEEELISLALRNDIWKDTFIS